VSRAPKVFAVDRYLDCMKHLFTKGKEWDIIEQGPFDEVKLKRWRGISEKGLCQKQCSQNVTSLEHEKTNN